MDFVKERVDDSESSDQESEQHDSEEEEPKMSQRKIIVPKRSVRIA